MVAVISVGDSFDTYEQFRDKLNEYMQTTATQFYRRDARTIAAARKRLRRPLNDEIKYYDIRFCCIGDGLNFRTRKQRPHTAS